MKNLMLSIVLLLTLNSLGMAAPTVEMKTNLGTVVIELNEEKAPITVKNFLEYVDQKYYDGAIFHRVIKGFMIQGGGFDADEKRKSTMDPIKNEATNGLKNIKGTIAMARTGVVDSATSQFFINLSDNDFLNNRGTSARTFGYAVFGKVTSGMDIVEKIGRIKTVAKSAAFKDFPEPMVLIESIRKIK
jgi:cyclophilin family peptidyl-prolyl cis-trans isomerase